MPLISSLSFSILLTPYFFNHLFFQSKSFVNKLSDSLGEEYETEVWLDYSKDSKYIDLQAYQQLMSEYDEVRKMLISMSQNPEKFCR